MAVIDLVSRVYEDIDRRADVGGEESLPISHRNAYLAWWARGLVGNGGFRFFFEGATNAQEVAEAFADIGIPAVADAFRRSLEVFPGGAPPEGDEERIDWLDAHVEAVDEAFDPLLGPVLSLTAQDLARRILDYLRANDPSFIDAFETGRASASSRRPSL